MRRRIRRKITARGTAGRGVTLRSWLIAVSMRISRPATLVHVCWESTEADPSISGAISRDERANHRRALLQKLSILSTESLSGVAVHIDLADDYSIHTDRHHDLRPGFERARQIPRIRSNVVHDHRHALSYCRAADSLGDRDVHVFRGRAVKRPQHQHARIILVQHVEPNPVVAGQTCAHLRNAKLFESRQILRGFGKQAKLLDDPLKLGSAHADCSPSLRSASPASRRL